MQPIKPFENTLTGDHPGIMRVKFGQNPMIENVDKRHTMHDGKDQSQCAS